MSRLGDSPGCDVKTVTSGLLIYKPDGQASEAQCALACASDC